MCKSLADAYESQELFSPKGSFRREFVTKFSELNLMLFQMNMADCSEEFIKKESENEETNSDGGQSGSVSPIPNSEGNFFVDLSSLLFPDSIEGGHNIESIVKFLTVKLSQERTIRLATEEELNLVKSRLSEIEETLAHYTEQVISVTTRIEEETLQVPEGKWLPTMSNVDDPAPDEQFWQKRKLQDKRGLKWYVVEQDVFNATRKIGIGKTFHNFLYSVFSKDTIRYYSHANQFPEQLKLACDELLGKFSILLKIS